MKKFKEQNFRNIQMIVQDKTGVDIISKQKPIRYKTNQMTALLALLICFVVLSAFVCIKFSDLYGDDAGFASAYQGDGKFEIVIINYSNRDLTLQNKVKVMQWTTGSEVEGNHRNIKMEGLTIAPHSKGIVSIDISEGYDVEAMERNLPDGDWYYFVLTNDNFAFWNKWMCSFNFEIEDIKAAESRLTGVREQCQEEPNEADQQYDVSSLAFPDWVWPTISQSVSKSYGEQGDGTYSDHINISGTLGDEIYAVADGVVIETGFERTYGNFIVMDLGNGITVKYGQLEESKVSAEDEIEQGQVIATLGKTGIATGPNLLFEVTVNGKKVNPLAVQ